MSAAPTRRQRSRVLLLRRPRTLTTTLFPYTTLFRSLRTLRLQGVRHRIQRNHAYRIPTLDGCLRHAEHQDRKSTRLNSSHTVISYAGFCLRKEIPAERG